MRICISLVLVLMTAMSGSAAPGDLDTTFGQAGRIPQPGWAAKVSEAVRVAVQADQKIVVAGIEGSFPNIPGVQALSLTRYRSDGSIDPTFGIGGKVVTRLAETCDSYVNDLALQQDGRIVLAARLDGCGAETGAYVLRFLPNGNLDPTFDGDGKVRVVSAFPGFRTTACRLAVPTDGKLILSCGEWRWEEDFWKVVLRLNPDGSLDTTFGGTGRVYLGADNSGPCEITIQPDGKIIASTAMNLTSGISVLLIRLNTDGSVDLSFGNSGWVVISVNGFNLDARAMALQPDNKIVLVGSYQSSFVRPYAARLLPDGSADTSFGGSGVIVYDRPNSYFSTVAIQRDGKIVTASDGGYGIARLLVSGGLDPTFGNNGVVVTTFPNPTGNPMNESGGIGDLAIQGNGRIISAGSWQGYGGWPDVTLEYRYPAIARYIGDPAPDSDFDGDGRADISVFRPSNSVWYLDRSAQGFSATQFGLATDKIASADYDGDGKTDIAVFRDGTWWRIDSSSSTIAALTFGTSDDIPVPADYTGDGRDEIAIYRNGQWWSFDLSNGQSSVVSFGIDSDKPVPADYDGDGKVDIAAYRDGAWWRIRSSDGTVSVVQFGLQTDIPVIADYDGDGKADPAVYRDGMWYLLQSTAGFAAVQWGVATDLPVPGDYDGDGKNDTAIFREGTWWTLRSSGGHEAVQFGLAGDRPIESAYLPRQVAR